MKELNRRDKRPRKALAVITLRVTAIVALISGFFSGLILDGQAYDHALIVLMCGVVAAACAIGLVRKYRATGKSRTGAWIMVCLGLVLAVVCLLGLPSAKRSQNTFNKLVEKTSQKQER